MGDAHAARRLWPLALLSALLMGLVWLHVQATLLGYKTSASRDSAETLRARNAYLRLEIERLESPAQLEKEARRRLGMQRPDPQQMVVLAGGAEPATAAAPKTRPGALKLASAVFKGLNL